MLRHTCISKRSIVRRWKIWLARTHSRIKTRSTMSTTLEAVRSIQLSEIQEARERIAKTIVRTPLLHLELGPGYPDIRLKLENLQLLIAFKLCDAAKAVEMFSASV